ncbi:MAG: HK97 family phage prohead protease [Rickettsiaceae bacterium]|nr:HK97 family phage prohead protease [Rickettsiaceae bacterium]
MEKGWVCSDFIVKSIKKENTVISGYASVFGVVDSQNDIIEKGAFKEAEGKNVKLLWQHDSTKPIGVINFIKEDEYGLIIEAEINNNTVAGFEASALVKQQAVGGLSIGFTIKSSDYNKEGSRVVQEVELREISIVTFPYNQYAAIQYVKKINIDDSLSEQQKLDNLSRLIQQIENY